MLELLEELLPNFKQEFNRRVTMQELTRLSIQLSPKTAIVISNQWMYVIQKKWLSLKM